MTRSSMNYSYLSYCIIVGHADSSMKSCSLNFDMTSLQCHSMLQNSLNIWYHPSDVLMLLYEGNNRPMQIGEWLFRFRSICISRLCHSYVMLNTQHSTAPLWPLSAKSGNYKMHQYDWMGQQVCSDIICNLRANTSIACYAMLCL